MADKIRFRSVASKHSLYELFGHVPARVFVSNRSYIDIGRFSYGAISRLIMWRNGDFDGLLLKVGDFCEFSSGSALLAGGEHDNENLNNFTFSSSPTFQKLLKRNGIETTHSRKGPILIGDGAIISYKAIVMSGVTIGDGAIIGAGALVASDCQPYGIYGGVPAKRIGARPRLEKTLAEIKSLDTLSLLDYFSKLHVPKGVWNKGSLALDTMRLVIRVEYPENYQPGQMYDFAIIGALDESSMKSYPLRVGTEFHKYASQVENIKKGVEFEWHPQPLSLAMN